MDNNATMSSSENLDITQDMQGSLMDSTKQDSAPTTRLLKKSILNQIKEANLEKVALFSGAGVDPDGIASMYTMAAILESWGYTPTCFYRGSFSRPQNKIMRQVLGLTPKPDTEFKAEDYTCFISLDGPAEICPVTPDFIIDHHEPGIPAKIASDVRMVGACSSIMWQYAQEAELDFSSEGGQKLATALALGIKTDTADGTADSSSELDFTALSFCLMHKDNKLFKEILNYSNPAYYHDLFVTGWHNKTIENSVLVTGIGHIPESRGAALSYLADMYTKTEGITTAIVFALVGGSIDISMRSKNSAVNVQEFVQTAFGGGGGKPGAGRVKIPMPLFENIPEELSNMLFESCFKIVRHKALQIAGDKK
jgi:nanoRNase/pAp phosphatase (c-di-AMP/oligoRNAs hydrolase)